MIRQTGIWIDKSKAIIISIAGGKSEIKEINSEIETRVRFQGETKQFGRFGNQYLSDQEKKEHRLLEQRKKFLAYVLEQIKISDQVVLFGPAEMKMELKKEMTKNHELSDKLAGVVSTDNMTNNQLVAWVKNYFNSKKSKVGYKVS
jgi:hypothetical protein